MRVAAKADVVVVGGGPAGLSAAIGAARNGAEVILLERYNHLGGLASGGMVLVLDDMWDSHLQEISVRGTCMDIIDRMAARKPRDVPDARTNGARILRPYRQWGALGHLRLPQPEEAAPVCFAAAFDPDAMKRVALEMVEAARHQAAPALVVLAHAGRGRPGQGRDLRLPRAAARRSSAMCVIDATGDLDVAASAGVPHVGGTYIIDDGIPPRRRRHRRGRALRAEEPEAFAALDRQIKRILGGSWGYWWLKTPLPGVVWCNCPHMAGSRRRSSPKT